ncbi:hypothetical protein [Elstera litoralis]|uniref:hypothetical protein n=1 Tax=Elstera litoralis TaxID=552518 RepID=UPI0018DD83B6|nr:hypothetical protein [Elstera litoralis]
MAPRRLAKNSNCHADRPGPNDENPLPGFHLPAPNRVRADGEKLQHRRLIERNPLGLMHEFFRQAEVFGKGPVAVNA